MDSNKKMSPGTKVSSGKIWYENENFARKVRVMRSRDQAKANGLARFRGITQAKKAAAFRLSK